MTSLSNNSFRTAPTGSNPGPYTATQSVDLRLRPPSPTTLDFENKDRFETGRNGGARSFIRGAVVGGAASAIGYALPYSAAFSGMNAVGQTGVLAGISTFCGGASHPLDGPMTRDARVWRATAAIFTAAAAAVAGTAFGLSPSFVALSTAAKLSAWAALSLTSAGVNTIIAHHPTLVAATAAGFVAGAGAALFLVTSPSALIVAAAGAVGAGAGATLHREMLKFKEHAGDNAIVWASWAAAAALACTAAMQ